MNLFGYLKKQSIFKDKGAIWMMIVGILMVLFEVLISLLRIKQQVPKVPIRYSDYSVGFEERGFWYSLYNLPFFVLSVYIVNSALAMRIHSLQPGLAKSILGVTMLIILFGVLVTWALTGLS